MPDDKHRQDKCRNDKHGQDKCREDGCGENKYRDEFKINVLVVFIKRRLLEHWRL